MTEITKYPLFGKSRLTKDVLSDEIGFDKGHCIAFPAISPGKSTERSVTVYNDVPVRPFSNGSAFDSWTCSNCDKCKKQNPQVRI
jgi:hypothetical protein